MVKDMARQLHMSQFRKIPGLDEYEILEPRKKTLSKLSRRYNARIYREMVRLYVSWCLGREVLSTPKKSFGDKELKSVDNLSKFVQFRDILKKLTSFDGETKDDASQRDQSGKKIVKGNKYAFLSLGNSR
jgi:hypothetical protein